MSNREENKLNEQVLTILHEYDELKHELFSLLNDGKKSKSRIRGAITSAGVATENILLYIIRDSGRVDKLDALKPNQRGIYEYKKIVEDIVPRAQMIHIGTITPFRNDVSHSSKGDFDEDELRAVEVAINSITKWFFETYLKGEFADFSKNQYIKKEKELSQDELDKIKKNFEKNPFNIPDYSILSKSKKAPKPKKKRSLLLLIIILFSISYSAYYLYQVYFIKKSTHSITKPHLNKEQVLTVLHRYYESSNDKKFDAHKYFANHVDQFYLRKNVNPTEIEIIRQLNVDYIDNKNTINPESLVLIAKNDSISYWQFSGEYICYRTSKKKFQKCNVLMEYGINTDGKIARIKQISYSKPEYTKQRPY